ncbi:hypothetical protein [Mucilaginibacter sp. 10I4]|uniref:hypothetical protein n=1 Tax=Mucilaginibacter sp. 10I4 TaxID=3048580 RepID=UPI002B22A48C|nr:hypothetical protein [Mucilaginibacter sp. 10I4]MEB0260754.1 hypothetical protein [Mucilaginibacter sp. 10I4]
MTKSDLDARLKNDATDNKFLIDGDYIVFDKKSNLNYEVIPHFTLKVLLTSNPLSKTRLSKGVLLSLNTLRETVDCPFTIRASYHSPEYHLLSFGFHDSDLYTTGNALSIGVPPDFVEPLLNAVQSDAKIGEYGVYSWGLHIGYTKDAKTWDFRKDAPKNQLLTNLLTNDKMKNIALIGAAAAAVWFFFIKK